MTLGRKTGGRDFKPGQSGNPNGRPKMPAELKKAKNMNKIKFMELLVKYLSFSLDELKAAKSDKSTTALDRIVISIILNAISKGDEKRLDFLMSRIIGKVKSDIDLTTMGQSMNQSGVDLSKLTDEEIKAILPVLRKAQKSD